MLRSSRTQDMLDQVEELYSHPRNQENLKMWVPQPHGVRDKWRGVPASLNDTEGNIPIVVNMEVSLQSAILRYSVKEYFYNPEVYLDKYLEYTIYRFAEIQDNVPILLHIPIYLGVPFEASLFGAEVLVRDDVEPWVSSSPVIKNLSSVGSMQLPDFNTGKVMSSTKHFYEYLCEQVSGRGFSVSFTEWMRGPLGLAMDLYGIEEFLIALIQDPDGVHRLMDYLTESRIKWTKQRAEYLGEEKYPPTSLYSDEVNSPMISPKHYLEFVQPYELAIAELHGGINYWHNCGDCTNHLDYISALPIELFHVGPWTDIDKAIECVCHDGTALEICLHPIDDVYKAKPSHIEDKIRRLLKQITQGGARAFFIEAGPLDRYMTVEEDFDAIRRWVEIGKRTLGNIHM